MAGNNGGARPGAGRKKKTTVEEQLSRRDVLLDVFTPAEWRKIALALLSQAKGGNLMVLLPYLPYLLGSPKQEINITMQIDEIAAEYGVPTSRVTSIVDRLRKQKAG